MMAIHPSQVAPINAAFTPSPDEVARAGDRRRLRRQPRRRRATGRRQDGRCAAPQAGAAYIVAGGLRHGSFDRGIASEAKQSRARSEEHTSELQSLMRISYAVLCLKKKNK